MKAYHPAVVDGASPYTGHYRHYELLPEHILSQLPETFVDREAPAQGSPGKYQFFDLRSGTALFRVPAVERIRVSRTRLRASLVSGIDI